MTRTTTTTKTKRTATTKPTPKRSAAERLVKLRPASTKTAAATPPATVTPAAAAPPANAISYALAEMAKRPLRAVHRSPTEQRAELVTLRHHDGVAWNMYDAAPLGLLAAVAVGADTTRGLAEEALESLADALSILDSAIDDSGGRGDLHSELVCRFLQRTSRQARVAAELSARFAAAEEYRKTASCGLVPALEGAPAKGAA